MHLQPHLFPERGLPPQTDQFELLTRRLLTRLSLIRRVRRYRPIGVAYGNVEPGSPVFQKLIDADWAYKVTLLAGGKSKHRS